MRKILIFILLLSFLPLISASINDLGTVKQYSCLQLPQTCASCTYNNISSVQLPDRTFVLNGNYEMTKTGQNYNYTFCETNKTGLYTVAGHGDKDGTDQTFSYIFTVTSNGNGLPSGGVIVLFILIFLIIMGSLVWIFVLSIGHIFKLDLDIADLSKNLGLYFIIFSLYMLSKTYLGNVDIEGFLLILIQVGAITHVLVPLIGFAVTLLVGGLKKGKVEVPLPKNRRWPI